MINCYSTNEKDAEGHFKYICYARPEIGMAMNILKAVKVREKQASCHGLVKFWKKLLFGQRCYPRKFKGQIPNYMLRHKVKAGITGWAQINGRDEIPIPEKVALDVEYLKRQSFFFDIKILWLTFKKVLKKDGISH